MKAQFNLLQVSNEHSSLIRKLHPTRFPRMTERMAAIVGFLLDETFTTPAITELIVTSDHFVLAQADGEIGANRFIGTYADLLRNWLDLVCGAGLTTAERIEADARFAARIGFYGPSGA
jgi:hypothetical protein